MAENTVLNPGVGGDVIATEDIGTYKIQRIKIVLGAQDVDGGDVTSANPMPVSLATPIPAGSNVIGSLAANQSVNISQVGGASITLGQKTMANSMPVVLASDQSTLNVLLQAGSNVIGSLVAHQSTNVDQVGGATFGLGQATMALSLPVAIASNQGALPNNITQVGGSSVGLGQNVMASSFPVVIASNQSSLNVVIQAGANIIGSLAANQSVNIAQFGGTGVTIGQKVMATSMPVVLASDQAAIPVSQSGSWTVTANAGSNLNTSALALESGGNLATLASAVLAQASTTSGQKGHLAMAAVATAAPAYTNAQTNPLSLTPAGALRTDLQSVGGTLISALSDGAAGGLTGVGVSLIATNFVLSPTVSGNSTTTQLTAGSTFTGTVENVYNQQAISILLTSDQPGTLTLFQYIDAGGTRIISTWVFAITASVPFSRCFTANGNYFKLTFQNTGASATTTLNINTAYGTLPAVTNLGYAPVSLNEINGVMLNAGQQTMANSIPIVIASNQTSIPVAGDVANGSSDSGNPVKVGYKAVNAFPAAVTNAQRVNGIADLFGRQLTSHIDPNQSIWKEVEATTTQTGTAIWTPASGKRIAITSILIATGGATQGVVTVWFGASGDTTYTQGTDQVAFRGELAPAAGSKVIFAQTYPHPLYCLSADFILRYTTSANMTIYITVYGYEF